VLHDWIYQASCFDFPTCAKSAQKLSSFQGSSCGFSQGGVERGWKLRENIRKVILSETVFGQKRKCNPLVPAACRSKPHVTCLALQPSHQLRPNSWVPTERTQPLHGLLGTVIPGKPVKLIYKVGSKLFGCIYFNWHLAWIRWVFLKPWCNKCETFDSPAVKNRQIEDMEDLEDLEFIKRLNTKGCYRCNILYMDIGQVTAGPFSMHLQLSEFIWQL
jgi:hypothetical protein